MGGVCSYGRTANLTSCPRAWSRATLPQQQAPARRRPVGNTSAVKAMGHLASQERHAFS